MKSAVLGLLAEANGRQALPAGSEEFSRALKAFSKTRMQANCKVTVSAGPASGWHRLGDGVFETLGKGERRLPASRLALHCIQISLLIVFLMYGLLPEPLSPNR